MSTPTLSATQKLVFTWGGTEHTSKEAAQLAAVAEITGLTQAQAGDVLNHADRVVEILTWQPDAPAAPAKSKATTISMTDRKTIAGACEGTGVPLKTAIQRVKLGWSIAKATTEPKRPRTSKAATTEAQ